MFQRSSSDRVPESPLSEQVPILSEQVPKTAELATDVVEPAEVAMDNVEAVAEPVVDAEAREGLE